MAYHCLLAIMIHIKMRKHEFGGTCCCIYRCDTVDFGAFVGEGEGAGDLWVSAECADVRRGRTVNPCSLVSSLQSLMSLGDRQPQENLFSPCPQAHSHRSIKPRYMWNASCDRSST